MPVMLQDWITREDLKNNPDRYYLFGDNLKRAGLGGQAGAMRGEPNAIGVATKNGPSMNGIDMWIEDGHNSHQFIEILKKELAPVEALLEQNYIIVIPSDGLGTGLSKLPENAPETHQWLNERLFEYYPKQYGTYSEANIVKESFTFGNYDQFARAVYPTTYHHALETRIVETSDRNTALMGVISRVLVMLENEEPHHVIISSIQDDIGDT